MRAESRIVRATDGRYITAPVHTSEQWNEDDYHCPCCGTSPVYVQPGDGDYYVGPLYICTACASSWTLQDGGSDDLTKQRAGLIKEVVNA